jgi:7-cyano-7-deazaguanine synthase
MNKALVLFSGGQDSTTCLMWALEKFDEVYTVGFEYGQKHSVEMECRQKILQSIESIKPNWKNKLFFDHVCYLVFLYFLNVLSF